MLDVGALYQHSAPNLAISLFVPGTDDTARVGGAEGASSQVEAAVSEGSLRVLPLNALREIKTCSALLGIDTVVLSIEAGLRRDVMKRQVLDRLKAALLHGQWLVLEVSRTADRRGAAFEP